MIKQNEKCGTQEIYAWKSFNIFNKMTYYEKRGTQKSIRCKRLTKKIILIKKTSCLQFEYKKLFIYIT